MTAQTRTVLKTYFETGDLPTQAQFADLIDSFLVLTGTTPQTIPSAITVSGAATFSSTVSAQSLSVTTSVSAATLSVTGNSVLTGTLNVAGAITPSSTNGLVGTVLADSVNAGSVGELNSVTVTKISPVSILTGVSKNVATLPLQAGDYDVWSTGGVVGTASTVLQYYGFDITTVSGTQSTDGTLGSVGAPLAATNITGRYVWPVGPARINVATSSNVFLVTNCGFTTDVMSAYGTLVARRRR